jgi:hypothetical protein
MKEAPQTTKGNKIHENTNIYNNDMKQKESVAWLTDNNYTQTHTHTHTNYIITRHRRKAVDLDEG